MRLGPGPEFDRIRTARARLEARAGDIGDDCAVVDLGNGQRLAWAIDLAVENTHFKAGWLTYYEIGYRATTAALSDLAAMAADPIGVLLSVGFDPELPSEFYTELMDGAGDAASAVGAKVLGGDTVRSAQLVVDVAVLGGLAKPPVLRSGAQEGDTLYVTGLLGGVGAALGAWQRNEQPDRSARERFARPAARVAAGQWLQAHGAHAMIDISDGLGSDASHLAAASGVACVIDLEKIPLHEAASSAEAAFVSGEEYELLVALPPLPPLPSSFADQFGFPLTPVGKVTPGNGVSVTRGERPVEGPLGFQHFVS